MKSVKNVDIVIHLAAKVGGIGFNLKNPGILCSQNIIFFVEENHLNTNPHLLEGFNQTNKSQLSLVHPDISRFVVKNNFFRLLMMDYKNMN